MHLARNRALVLMFGDLATDATKAHSRIWHVPQLAYLPNGILQLSQ
jgi:hypothetical protein